jgi:mono/diheme cytochrome c family protein
MQKLILAGLIFSVNLVAQDAAKGKELYVKYSCYACHSFDGHGGAGARLVPMKLMLPVFTAYVRAPRAMPAYREKAMSNAELADVWAYIKTIPESPPAKSIPLLRDLDEGR